MNKRRIGVATLLVALSVAVCVVSARGSVAGKDTKTPSNSLENAVFTVQNHDIGVKVAVRHLDKSATANHPVILGCFVTVLLSDLWELTSAPQCHWDGVNEKSRYSYTLFFHQRGVKGDWVESYSINLLDFASTSTGSDGRVQITPMGVMPEDGIVTFQPAKFNEVVSGTDSRRFAGK